MQADHQTAGTLSTDSLLSSETPAAARLLLFCMDAAQLRLRKDPTFRMQCVRNRRGRLKLDKRAGATLGSTHRCPAKHMPDIILAFLDKGEAVKAPKRGSRR
jgi:hypothetical protein